MIEETNKTGGKPSNPFARPNSPRTYSTELENTDTFGLDDISELGFIRSNPSRAIYFHKHKPSLMLEEVYATSPAVKDRVVRLISIFYKKSMTDDKVDLYFSSVPNKEDIENIIINYEG